MIKGIVKTRIYVEIITNWPSRGTEFVFLLGGIPVVFWTILDCIIMNRVHMFKMKRSFCRKRQDKQMGNVPTHILCYVFIYTFVS